MERRYRPNVAVVVLSDSGALLAGERSDNAGAWQLPQGGIEPGESPREAMFRELREEIGTDEVEVLDELPYALCYDWPPHYQRDGCHGQEQFYFLVRLKAQGIDWANQVTEEFRGFRWMTPIEFLKVASGFKLENYRKALREFYKRQPNVIQILDMSP